MKIDLAKIGAIIGILVPLWGGYAFLYNYEKKLVKQDQLALATLDASIEHTEIMIAILSRDVVNHSEADKIVYERSKARLISLESQRDKLLGVVSD